MKGTPATGERHNLFFALLPDRATGEALVATVAALRADAATPPGRWLAPARHHLTLHFLGNHAPAATARILAQAIAAAARVRGEAFRLVLDRCGSFGRRRATVWLGPGEAPPALLALHAALGIELEREGIAVEPRERFVPHLTVLRDAAASFGATLREAIVWPVATFALIDSRIQPPAPYRLVAQWPLAAASGQPMAAR